jgi:hypothetical protein
VFPADTFKQFWRIYQYIAVTPNQQVTVCGQFAAGGRPQISLRLRDGDENAFELANREIFNRDICPAASFDWVPACATATPSGGLLTVEYRVAGATRDPAMVLAGHADKLVMTQGPPPAEICNNGIDDDGDRRTDCQDSDCAAAQGCSPPPAEVCGNGIDDDGDLLTDCDDSDCVDLCHEICANGIDDDGDCTTDETDCVQGEICNNGTDDDSDGFIDCLDSDCVGGEFCPCNTPFADADADMDVDQDDFAIMQGCVTGTLAPPQPALPPACACFDRDADRDIDQTDFTQFNNCNRTHFPTWSTFLRWPVARALPASR